MSDESDEWKRVASVGDIEPGNVRAVSIGEHEIALYNVDGTFFATDNICTHAFAQLSEGFLEDHEIECPLHFGRFDVRTGKGLCEPITSDLKTYAVRVSGGEIEIKFPDV